MLKRLFDDYRRRFHERAPEGGAPVPLLAQKRLDVVAVNGGRALHFFFSEPVDAGPSVLRERRRRMTRLHDVTLWPPTVPQLKQMEQEGPGSHRDLVRRVARIQGELYVHFVLFPDDGGLFESIGAVGRRLAEREVARYRGERLEPEVPAHEMKGKGSRPPWDPELDPAP